MVGSVGALLVASCLSAPNAAYSEGGTGGGEGSSSAVSTADDPDDSGVLDGGGTDDGPVVGCGNGSPDPGEDCDDGNDDNADGCLTDCTVPRSCLDIYELDPTALDGTYEIAPYDDRPSWGAWCDMENELHGGGWTKLTLADVCQGRIDELITPLQDAVIFERDEQCRVATRDEGGGHAYTWDIEFPPGFEELYLDGFAIRNNSAPGESLDLLFVQTSWAVANDYPNGAVSVGAATDPGPVTTWAAEEGPMQVVGDGEVAFYPRLDDPFVLLEGPSTTVRIGWGEAGPYSEGMYPWWEGSILVR